MSPKKKSKRGPMTPAKDDLINELLDADSGQAHFSLKTPHSKGPGQRTPPPPGLSPDEAVFVLDEELPPLPTDEMKRYQISSVDNKLKTGEEAVPRGLELDLTSSLIVDDPVRTAELVAKGLPTEPLRVPSTGKLQPPPPPAERPRTEVRPSPQPPRLNEVPFDPMPVAVPEKKKPAPPVIDEQDLPTKRFDVDAADPRSTPSPLADFASPEPMPSLARPSTQVFADARTEIAAKPQDIVGQDRGVEAFMPTVVKPNSPGAKFREKEQQIQPGATVFTTAEAALRSSENLRVAQGRISELEQEIERVRRENNQLRQAGETLRRQVDQLKAGAESSESDLAEFKRTAEEERKVLRSQVAARDREISDLKALKEDIESRLESNFKKIRVRERDLEHRIEIIKSESASITSMKDKMILELKRQIDQLKSELEHANHQTQQSFKSFKEKQETVRKAVRALRIALTVLEGEDDEEKRNAS